MATTTTTTTKYELTVLVDELADQKLIDKLTEKIKGYGKITNIEDDGVKRLAYSIRDHEKAHYLFYELELERENDAPAKLSSNLNIDDDVMRYLLVRVSK